MLFRRFVLESAEFEKMELLLDSIFRNHGENDENRLKMVRHVLANVDMETSFSNDVVRTWLSDISTTRNSGFAFFLEQYAFRNTKRFLEMFDDKTFQSLQIEGVEFVLRLRKKCGARDIVPKCWAVEFEKRILTSWLPETRTSTVAISMLWKYARHLVRKENCVNIISISARDFSLSGSVDSLQIFRHVLLETAGKREQVLCAVVAVQLIFETCLIRRNDEPVYLLRCASLLRCVPLNLKSVCSLTVHSKYFLCVEDVVTMYESILSVWPASSGELYQWLNLMIVEFLKAKRFNLIRAMSCETQKISMCILNSLIRDTRSAPSLALLERLLVGSLCFREDEWVSKRLEDALRHTTTLPAVIRTRLERVLLVRRHLEPISISILRNMFFKTSWILPQPSTCHNVGSRNLGNTCYMNAALQALYACRSFRQCVLFSEGNGFCVELRRLFAMMSLTQRAYTDTSRLRSSLPKQFDLDFKSFRQQDAHEWIVTLLDLFVSATRHNEEKLKSTLGVRLRQDICCDSCSSISSQEILNVDLSLCFSQDKTERLNIQDMIDSTFLEERMNGDNMVYCESCKAKMSSRKRMCAVSEPDILILSLKRFRNLSDKIMTSVNLSRHVRYGDGRMYRLRSVIVRFRV